MPVSTSMKMLLLMVLFLIVACGRGSSDSSNPPEKEIEAKWTISSSAVNFPQNFEIKFDGRPALNTCSRPESAKVSEEAERSLIEFSYDWIPETPFQVEILDLGVECDNNAIFHQEESVVYGVIELRTGAERNYSVSVNLYN